MYPIGAVSAPTLARIIGLYYALAGLFSVLAYVVTDTSEFKASLAFGQSSWLDLHRPEWDVIAISIAFLRIGVWLTVGSVTTNQIGIAKSFLGYRRSFKWKDITEIRLHKRQGGAIELRSGPQKLIVDFRCNAFHLLSNAIKDRTNLRPIGELS